MTLTADESMVLTKGRRLAEANGEPEKINNSSTTAPSKRIEGLKANYRKVKDGVSIAQVIGIDKMREACPLFNDWLSSIEKLQKTNSTCFFQGING